jgi:XTP/dITP diphosphohydrolase
MRKLLVATRNRGKIPEIENGLAGLPFELVTLDDAGVPGDLDIAETAETFEGNAILKAEGYGRKAGLLTIADDSGLSVDALNGQPGVQSARYASGSDADRYMKLLDVMKDVPDEERTAQFTSVIAIYDPTSGKIETCEGLVRGKIMREPRGEFGFGYDPVFYSDELGARFAEVPTAEKQKGDHRGKALAKARDILKSYI